MVKDPALARAIDVPSGELDGYLAAGPYVVGVVDGRLAFQPLLAAMVAAQQQAVAQALHASPVAATPALDAHSLVVLASMVDKETRDERDRPLVASVLYNRWRAGWHLASEATLAAALGHADGALRREERATDHPFNTFVRLGLPPSPVCSPSQAALGAVAGPHSDARVMFHDPGGRHGLELPPEERAALAAITFDPPPSSLTRGIHYLVSNERKPDYVAPALAELGGVLIGVGTDQNFLYAGWARPDLFVAMDFDGMVADLHGVYGVAFAAAPTPKEFLALFAPEAQPAFEALIRKAYAGPGQKDVLAAYRWALAKVTLRMGRVIDRLASVKVPSYLSDPEQYAHVAALFRYGRVVRLRGDLTGKITLRAVGGVLSRSHRPLGILYVSNAEQYFDYGADYRANIASLPADADSVVLHTWTTGNGYNFIVQPLAAFQQWLVEPRVKNAEGMLPPLAHEQPLVLFGDLPKHERPGDEVVTRPAAASVGTANSVPASSVGTASSVPAAPP